MTQPDHAAQIAFALTARPQQVAAAIELLDAGNTVPFIARYRKEATGGLDDERLRSVESELARLRALDGRRTTILASIEAQGRLTDEVRRELMEAPNRARLEDLYRPYRPKRRTRATMARERGLGPLAERILRQDREDGTAEEIAAPFVGCDVPTPQAALAGARDIVAEVIADDAEVRRRMRLLLLQSGRLVASRIEGAADERGVYELYYRWNAAASGLRPHQVLALDRGESTGVLRLRIDVDELRWQSIVERAYPCDALSPLSDQLAEAAADGVVRLLLPSIERDVRRSLTEQAHAQAIGVFAANLRALLGGAPLSGRTVLGIDPGLRTGCKLAVVDPTGRVLATGTVYPHPPQRRLDEALDEMAQLIDRHGVDVIAIGNGTASRETEAVVARLTGDRQGRAVRYLLTSEAGASVYSASPLARRELPDLDVSLRGAVSIARRVQDPLAELVKIEPRAIGVGMYQHDVDQTELARALDAVVESVVNAVGVDANTASAALLTRVAGIGPKLAADIVEHRDRQGPMAERRDLLAVRGLGPKAFEQCAGFVRVHGGREPLDATAIHPESYGPARALLARAGLAGDDPAERRADALAAMLCNSDPSALAAGLGVGLPTVLDILEQLARPGRDPREDVPPPLLRTDVLSTADLRPGMTLSGTVRNVVDFGAFIDIGVKTVGLLHRSRMPRGTRLAVGDVVEVVVRNLEADRGRIGLDWPAPGE